MEVKSLKEERIRAVSFVYYSRSDIKKAIYNFSKSRENVPSYMMEGFGKRPDSFQYESDIISWVSKGATSFHCSEELWKDPLAISTEMTEEQLNDLREGWDLLIDIDCKYLEYSKMAAASLIKAMEFHGVDNVGVKFSVSGDTDVLIECNKRISLMPISEAIEMFKRGEKIKVLSLNKGNLLQLSNIYDYLEHEDALYSVLHSQSKVPLKVTGHHSVFVWDMGEIVEKKVTELKEGDFLVSFNSASNPLCKTKRWVTNKFTFSKNQFVSKTIRKKVQLNGDLMRLIGYFLAEGHTTKIINQTGFSFNIKEKEYIEDCVSLLNNLTGRKISLRHPNPSTTQIMIHSKEWHDFFKENCGEKKDKHIPEFSWGLPKPLFLEMLRGYIRGDGYKVGEYGIEVKSVSKRLIKEFIWLCKLNRISCSLSYENNKPHRLPQGNYFKGSFVYILKIPKSELSSLEFKRPRNKFSPFPGDLVFPVDGLKRVYQKIKPKMFNHHRLEQMTLKKKKANLPRIFKVLEWFEKFGSIEADEECRNITKNYRNLFNSDISIVDVKKITREEKQKVYDVSVEETESFFGNDFPILLHNSGNKGFHIIVPWQAFPKEVYGQKTKDMFPKFPRLICQYLTEVACPILEEEIEKEEIKFTSKLDKGTICLKCKKISEEFSRVILLCPVCKREESSEVAGEPKKKKCPDCRKEMVEKAKKEFYRCKNCNIDSIHNPDNFRSSIDLFKVLGVDVVLVSPRHLFRMPYSLHEKTALASVVIDKKKIREFQVKDANPLKVVVKEFLPNAREEEARELLIQAIDWGRERKQDSKKKPESPSGFKEIVIKDLTPNLYPPCMTEILKGLKQDGRKRALFILFNFFKSLKLGPDEIEKRIEEWNKTNYKPLKEGYIRSQLNWHSRQKAVLPPNCDKPHYKDLAVCKSDGFCRYVKNPVNYVIKKNFLLMKERSNAKPKRKD